MLFMIGAAECSTTGDHYTQCRRRLFATIPKDATVKSTNMDLPINFPSDVAVVAEEAARFRALSPEDRLRSIRGLLAAGALMMQRSPKAAFLREHTAEQEARARQAVKEFLARHAG
jgi:hypothetical protein